MEIPIVSTKETIKAVMAGGGRFDFAPSVTHVELATANIFSHICVANALEASSSITSVKLCHAWTTASNITAIILRSLHSSKVLKELDVESSNEEFFSSVGELLMENSSIQTLSIKGFGCLSSDRKTSFFSGVANSNLVCVNLKAFNSYNVQKVNTDFKKLISALQSNPAVLKFEIRSLEWPSELAPKIWFSRPVSPSAMLSGNEYLTITITRREREPPLPEVGQLDQLIDRSNWEELANFLRTNCPKVLIKAPYSEEHNLNTKTFVDKLAIHSLKKLVEDVGNEKIKVQSEVEHNRKHCTDLTKQRDNLRLQLATIEAELNNTEAQVQSSNKLLSEKNAVQTRLEENLQLFENTLKKNEPALKKWQQKLQTEIGSWCCEDVAFLLTEIGLGRYSHAFLTNKIDGLVIKALETSDLISILGVSFKEAKKLLMYLHLVQTHHDIYTVPAGVLQWNNDTVCTWLQDNKFSHLVDIFRKNQVSGAEFVFLEKADLTSHLKIQALGDVIKLQIEIGILKDSLKDDHGLQVQLNNTNNQAPNPHLERQLEEMKRFNDALKIALKEKNTKIPEAFICPITQDMMTDPVVASDGHTYERTAIEQWLKNNNTSPMTGLQLSNKQLTPSHTLKSMIREFVDAAKKK